jgi:hypothetical protein
MVSVASREETALRLDLETSPALEGEFRMRSEEAG